jgi:hypothetical protein
MEEHRLWVFENRVLRKISVPKEGRMWGGGEAGEDYTVRNFITCTLS